MSEANSPSTLTIKKPPEKAFFYDEMREGEK
jgi:hypothetical protein